MKTSKPKNVKLAKDTPLTPCGDPVRVLFDERVGQYFRTPPKDERHVGTCFVCGKEIVAAATDSAKNPQCAEQRVIAQKRNGPEVGFPVAFGSPPAISRKPKMKNKKPVLVDGKPVMVEKIRDKFCIGAVGAVTLISPDRTFLAVNALPTKPLPPEMTAIPVSAGVQAVFWQDFLTNPPQAPFLLVLWTKKGTVPLAMSESLTRTAVCGGESPFYVNMKEVRALLPLAQRMGMEDFQSACSLRARYAAAQSAPEVLKLGAEIAALRDKHDLTTKEFRSLPVPKSSELGLVKLLMEGPDEAEVEADDDEEIEELETANAD